LSNHVWGNGDTQFFYSLTPEVILNSIETLGLEVTGRCLTLNSMENRVYEVEIEIAPELITKPSDKFIIVKFYRPGRWSKEQIQEEHDFLLDLKENEISVIAPLLFDNKSIFKLADYEIFFSLFPKQGGRIPQEMTIEQLEITGRLLARMHNVGASRKSSHRLNINTQTFGEKNLAFLLDNNFLPIHLAKSYEKLVLDICNLSQPLFEKVTTHRIHGDCHLGNIISRDNEGMFLIDFDDMLVGPAVQDIWLVVPGRDQYALQDRAILLEAYESMRDFDYSSLKLIEPLRTLRYIHFSSWIAKRWDDPAFKNAFSHFGDSGYWEIQVNDLQEQYNLINANLN